MPLITLVNLERWCDVLHWFCHCYMEVCHQSVDKCVRVSFSNTMNLTWKYKAHQPESLHTTSISSFNIITVITVNLFIVNTGLQVSLTHCIFTHCCDSLVPFLKKEKITNEAGSIHFCIFSTSVCCSDVSDFLLFTKKNDSMTFFQLCTQWSWLLLCEEIVKTYFLWAHSAHLPAHLYSLHSWLIDLWEL